MRRGIKWRSEEVWSSGVAAFDASLSEGRSCVGGPFEGLGAECGAVRRASARGVSGGDQAAGGRRFAAGDQGQRLPATGQDGGSGFDRAPQGGSGQPPVPY